MCPPIIAAVAGGVSTVVGSIAKAASSAKRPKQKAKSGRVKRLGRARARQMKRMNARMARLESLMKRLVDMVSQRLGAQASPQDLAAGMFRDPLALQSMFNGVSGPAQFQVRLLTLTKTIGGR